MTTLESRLATLNLQWVWKDRGFTAVYQGFGFVVYCQNGVMWLCVLSRETTAKQLVIYETEPPQVAGFWQTYNTSYTERMFEVPASDEFLTHVIESAFPEMLSL